MSAFTNEQIERIRNGKVADFEVLFNYYYPRIKSFAIGFLKNEDEACEAAQIALTKVWQCRDRLLTDRNFDSYIFTIAKNVVNDIFRDKYSFLHYREQYLADLPGTGYEIERDIDVRDMRKLIDEIINSMPEQRRQVFVLSRKYFLTNEQIAQKLNISKRTVEKHISLALNTIRKKNGEFFLWLILFFINF